MQLIIEAMINHLDQLQDNTAEELLEKMIKQSMFEESEYGILGAFLGIMVGVKLMHHAHHWQTNGSSQYGDHLLFQRLYEDMDDEIDVIGEKLVGLQQVKLTNYFTTLKNANSFLEVISKQQALFIESLKAEHMLITIGEIVVATLRDAGLLTTGLEQALGDILNKHETHLYLLQQREKESY